MYPEESEMKKRISVIFGRCLFMEMKDREVNIEELSFRIGIPSKVIRAYLRGNRMPSIYTIIKICRVLRCDVNKLMPFCNPDFKILKNKRTDNQENICEVE